jgi:hypothetical protein
MSLTTHLNNPSSPVGQFIRERFPQTFNITKMTNSQLRSSDTIFPASHPWPYDKIGIAIDYRIRYSFAITPSQQLVAWAGLGELAFKPLENEDDIVIPWEDIPQGLLIPASDGLDFFAGAAQGPYRWEIIETFFNRLDEMLVTIQPVGRRLTMDEERIMARYCFILALFEEVYRSNRYKDGPLFVPSPKQSIDELLAIPEDAWIDDLSKLSLRFYDTCHQLLSRPFVLNPTFLGSRDVGGADADLIVDSCLIEIKTSKLTKIDPDWLRQLAGYLLLDYNEEHHIQSLGIYMARQGLLFRWSVDEFLATLTGKSEVSLSQLRQEFRQLFLSKRVR